MQVDTPTQKEIDIFIQAIAMNPAIVSLKGYAEVNRELLTGVSYTCIWVMIREWRGWGILDYFFF